MKIKDLTSKTSFEVNENDVLVIEDGEDTKQITVKEFREYLLGSGITKTTKMLINVDAMRDFIFGGSKITMDSACKP